MLFFDLGEQSGDFIDTPRAPSRADKTAIAKHRRFFLSRHRFIQSMRRLLIARLPRGLRLTLGHGDGRLHAGGDAFFFEGAFAAVDAVMSEWDSVARNRARDERHRALLASATPACAPAAAAAEQ